MTDQAPYETTAILLINTGSPAAPEPEAVKSYLAQFLTDPNICPMPAPIWNVILRAFILPRRKVASAAKYAQIWTSEGSPLLAKSASLAQKLEVALNDFYAESDLERKILVRSAMMYGAPSINDTLAEFAQAGCARVLALPMYPQAAYSTSKAAFDALERALASAHLPHLPQIIRLPEYFDNGIYIDSLAQSVLDAGFGQPGDALACAFHSIPLADVAAGDTYVKHLKATCALLESNLQAALPSMHDLRFEMCFLSRFKDGRKWSGPFISDATAKLAGDSDTKRLFIIAPNFAIDNLETLYDIDIELRQHLAQQHPNTQLIYIPCLNNTPAQVSLLKDMVVKSL
jgi:ferrochelatase